MKSKKPMKKMNMGGAVKKPVIKGKPDPMLAGYEAGGMVKKGCNPGKARKGK